MCNYEQVISVNTLVLSKHYYCLFKGPDMLCSVTIDVLTIDMRICRLKCLETTTIFAVLFSVASGTEIVLLKVQ